MKKLIVLSGIPGSGKSTWTKQFVDSAEDGTVKVVSADINRLAIGGAKDNFDHETDVWKKVYDDILMYSFNDEVQVVIADNTSISNKSRLQYAKFKDLYELELLLFRVPAEECIRRNAERERPVPEDAMKRMINYWQEPSDEVKNIFTIKEIN